VRLVFWKAVVKGECRLVGRDWLEFLRAHLKEAKLNMKRGRDGMLRLIVCSLAGIFLKECLWHRCNMSQVYSL
jgi:hypothetical protein